MNILDPSADTVTIKDADDAFGKLTAHLWDLVESPSLPSYGKLQPQPTGPDVAECVHNW
ncbi:MAG: hypothetical protein ACRDRS_02075 [Pseudonocardiaceae bacterium]